MGQSKKFSTAACDLWTAIGGVDEIGLVYVSCDCLSQHLSRDRVAILQLLATNPVCLAATRGGHRVVGGVSIADT